MEPQKRKILVADDDLAILDALTLILEDAGYEVQTMSNGEGLQHIYHTDADLLLLDIWLSGWNGKDICMTLKKAERTRHLPILLFSASKETKALAREAGADDFITKPFDIDELLGKIEQHLSSSSGLPPAV
jgi:DNA-binding response OmpR family regulator